MSHYRTIKDHIERRTGLLFGFNRQGPMPRGTSIGQPIFYLRLGNGRDGLVRFEVGNRSHFAYVTKAADR